MQQRVEQMTQCLREQGLRMTPQRLAVLKALVNNRTHPSAEQIYDWVRKDFPTTSLATVYKTLAVLKETGQVTELGFSNDCNRYDLTTGPHAHLICVRWKSIMDPDLNGFTQASQQIAAQYGYTLLSQRMDFFGVCPKCQASTTPGG